MQYASFDYLQVIVDVHQEWSIEHYGQTLTAVPHSIQLFMGNRQSARRDDLLHQIIEVSAPHLDRAVGERASDLFIFSGFTDQIASSQRDVDSDWWMAMLLRPGLIVSF